MVSAATRAGLTFLPVGQMAVGPAGRRRPARSARGGASAPRRPPATQTSVAPPASCASFRVARHELEQATGSNQLLRPDRSHGPELLPDVFADKARRRQHQRGRGDGHHEEHVLQRPAIDQRCAAVVEGRQPRCRVRKVQLQPDEGDEEPDHQQEAQEAGVLRRAHPARKQVAHGRHQQPQRNERQRGSGQVASVERQPADRRRQRRQPQGHHRHDDRRGGQPAAQWT